jgi:hypothetical protein
MSFESTVPFDSTLTTNVNDQLAVAVAFDVPVGSYVQTGNNADIPHSAEGINLHPDYDYIYEMDWGIGLRGDYIFEWSWSEDQTVTQAMLDTYMSVVDQEPNGGSTAAFGELTQVDLIGRTLTLTLSVPPQPELSWRGPVGTRWGLLPMETRKTTWASPSHYMCYLLLDTDWRDWTIKARDIAPNSSLTIGRVEGASSVYLIFSEDVTTSPGVTLNRGVTYSQTSESLEVTAGNADTFVMRVSK